MVNFAFSFFQSFLNRCVNEIRIVIARTQDYRECMQSYVLNLHVKTHTKRTWCWELSRSLIFTINSHVKNVGKTLKLISKSLLVYLCCLSNFLRPKEILHLTTVQVKSFFPCFERFQCQLLWHFVYFTFYKMFEESEEFCEESNTWKKSSRGGKRQCERASDVLALKLWSVVWKSDILRLCYYIFVGKILRKFCL